MAIEKDQLDQLLAGRDPKDVFNKDVLVDELKSSPRSTGARFRRSNESGVCEFNSVGRYGNGLWRIDANTVLEEIHTLLVRLAVKGSVWDWISTQPQIFYYFAVSNSTNRAIVLLK